MISDSSSCRGGGAGLGLDLVRFRSAIYDASRTPSQLEEDMRTMFIKEFGLTPKNADTWIDYRNPITNVSHLRNNLPILILQGTNDLRVDLKEGYNMVCALENHGNPVTYLEIPGGDHGLVNQPNRMNIILNWLGRSNSTPTPSSNSNLCRRFAA